MRIWIFNPFDDLAWEGKPQRYATLARCLVERGHEVVYWSSAFSHRLKMKRKLPDDEVLDSEPYEIKLVDSPPYRSNVSLSRIWNHFCLGRNLYKDAKESVQEGEFAEPDLILVSMPPVEGPGTALRLKKLFGCKVILDVMDAWPETLLQAFPAPLKGLGRVLLMPYTRQLITACRSSDGISAQSEKFAELARAMGGSNKPTHICMLGADAVEGPPPLPEVDGVVRLIYLGAMGRSYDLETLLDAVKEINSERHKVSLAMVGDGEKRQALEARAIPNVEFKGFLSGQALHEELQKADLGVVPFLEGSGVVMPYKAGDYLAYGLPILSTVDGELGDFLRQYSCGVIYSAEDRKSFEEALSTYLSDHSKLAAGKTGAHECFKENFDREQIYPKFAQWIEGLAR